MDRHTTLNAINHTMAHPQGRLDSEGAPRVVLPLPPQMAGDTRFEMEVYARFMRHLRNVPNSRLEIKILSAIQFTADIMDAGDALVAKTLVDLGLRAPRQAFPVAFLDFADRGMMRSCWDTAMPPASVLKLYDHWIAIGESKFRGAERTEFSIFNDNVYVTA